MAKLTRRTVFQIAPETTYGEDPNNDYTALLAREGSEITVNGEQVTRDTLRDTLSPRGHVIGLKDQQITMPLELRGAGMDSGALNTPEIHSLLQASLMTQETGARIVLTGVSGTFERGEQVTNDTATNTVGTVADFDETNSVLFIRDLQNEPAASDSISGDASGASGEVDSTGDAYVYRPSSPDIADMPSVTAQYFRDGIRHRVLGARATFSLTMSVGQIPQISFTINGLYEKPTDQSNPSPSYLNLVPQPVFGANLTIGALDTSLVAVNELSMDLGNEIQWRDDIQAAAGRKAPVVTSRDPTGSIDPEATTLANFDPYADWEDGNSVAVAVGIGSDAGSRVRVVMPATQYTELPYAERNGILAYNLGFRATGTDDEMMLIYS